MSEPIEYRILQAIAKRVETIRTATGAAADIGANVIIGGAPDPREPGVRAVVNIDGETNVSAGDVPTKPVRSMRVVVSGIGRNSGNPLLLGMQIADDIERAVMAGESDAPDCRIIPTRRLNGLVARLSPGGSFASPSDQPGISRAYAHVAFDVTYVKNLGVSA